MRYDIGIVGAGIAGLSLAWHLHRAGKKVLVLEKSASADGASVRNFGMVWVVGQPPGDLHSLALRSRELWLEAAEDLEFWIRRSGSLTLAYDAIELKVLKEFISETGGAMGRHILEPIEIASQFPFIRQEGLVGGMVSSTEAAVDPREVVHQAASTLAKNGVDVRFDAMVKTIQNGQILIASGEVFEADRIVVCPGPALYDLYPEACQAAGLVESHLQMMRLKAKTSDVKPIGTHLCAGLTLSHYANFKNCPSLPALKEMHKIKWPKQVEHGIHVLVAEHADGTLTVGDSHAYGRGQTPYRNDDVDEAILVALDQFLPRDQYEVVQRWTGTYNTHSTKPYWFEKLADSVWGLNLFGTGMTLSFGLTERISQHLLES